MALYDVEPSELLLPMVAFGVCAGFPSPADDFLEEPIDLGKLLVINPPATFLWWVDGNSMRDAGIYNRDLLVVDRSLKPVDGDVVVVTVDGERSLKRLRLNGVGQERQAQFCFENSDFPAYEVSEFSEVEIWGVVRVNIHWHRPR